jgi:hypothetical protein
MANISIKTLSPVDQTLARIDELLSEFGIKPHNPRAGKSLINKAPPEQRERRRTEALHQSGIQAGQLDRAVSALCELFTQPLKLAELLFGLDLLNADAQANLFLLAVNDLVAPINNFVLSFTNKDTRVVRGAERAAAYCQFSQAQARSLYNQILGAKGALSGLSLAERDFTRYETLANSIAQAPPKFAKVMAENFIKDWFYYFPDEDERRIIVGDISGRLYQKHVHIHNHLKAIFLPAKKSSAANT